MGVIVINDRGQLGLSLIEVLIAIIIFAMVVIGLTDFQSMIMTKLANAKNSNLAEEAAFALLDSYPDPVFVDLPHNWQYRIVTTPYNGECKIVRVIIQPERGDAVKQERWFCKTK